jgi:hypothetical protein
MRLANHSTKMTQYSEVVSFLALVASRQFYHCVVLLVTAN